MPRTTLHLSTVLLIPRPSSLPLSKEDQGVGIAAAPEHYAGSSSGMATAPSDHSENTIVVEDLLLSSAQSRVHGRTDGLRCAHEFLGTDLGR